MTMREIQRYIETERAKLQDAIKLNTETREQEVNRRLKQRDEEWLGEMDRFLEEFPGTDCYECVSPCQRTFMYHMRQWTKENKS